MKEVDLKYKELVKYVLDNGIKKEDRTGTGTISVFGYQTKYNVEKEFPLLTLRKIHLPSLVHELLWFLESYDEKYKKFGNTNIKYLLDNKVTFWTEWCYENYKKQTVKEYSENLNKKKLKLLSQIEFEDKIRKDDEFALKWGDLGPVYGAQWKNWGGHTENVEVKNEYNYTKGETKVVEHVGWQKVNIKGTNQIQNVIDTLLTNPDSRRIIVSAWNVEEIDNMLLPPCHAFFQFYSFIDNNGDRRLSLQLYQRSADIGLGVPFNVASYSLLLKMVANIVNMKPFEFVHTIGDAHIYLNHIDQLNELLERDSAPNCDTQLIIDGDIEDIEDYRFGDGGNIRIEGYNPHPNIKMDVAV